MNPLVDAFEERLLEIEVYLDLLEALERQVQGGSPKIGGVIVTSQQQKILYSAVYLQLYNLVEATITRCVEAVSAAAANIWYPGDLSSQLRREWVRASARTHVDMAYDKRLESALSLCDVLVQALPISNWEVEKGRRGNWDDEQIREITNRLGVKLQISNEVFKGVKQPFRDDKGPLALVRDLRNRLAHGSLSFAECGEGATVADLRDLKQRTVLYLREVVSAFKVYIDGYGFLIPERRPVVEEPR